jgi:hypothetical protein
MRSNLRLSATLTAAAFKLSSTAHADVITDWDVRASAAAPPAGLGEREATIVDLAMFDAVNSIERKYRPYLVSEDGFGGASPEAAAAAAAETVLEKLHPEHAGEFKSALDDFLQGLPGTGGDVGRGIELGQRVGRQVFESRVTDGAIATDPYRPRTQPGVYVPTGTAVAATFPALRPFALERADQFRPGPPVALDSSEWASDYNEVKTLGARNSSVRKPEQTETARFWLMTGPQAYHPIARQIIASRQLDLIDAARFMGSFSVALTDAYISVFDAKYHYEFWRPITAIRNGDKDGNTGTEVDPSWQPLDSTPMHPEYPCAHCMLSGAVVAFIEANGGLGTLQEISLASTSIPGVTHRWSSLDEFASEVSNARVWAGFHYRSSTRVGTSMGRNVGQFVATHFAQPVADPAHMKH